MCGCGCVCARVCNVSVVREEHVGSRVDMKITKEIIC